MLRDKMLVEDIVQTVFLKFFENMHSIRNKDSISNWLFTTARNEIYTYFRSKKVKVDQFNVADAEDLELSSKTDLTKIYEMKELKELIMKELDKMPQEQSEVYFLKEYGQLSYKEIADVISIDENLVKSRLFKVRKKLIRNLSQVV